MRRTSKISSVLLGLVIVLALTASAQSLTPGATSGEFTLPIPADDIQNWPVFVGVGYTLHYPPGWQALPHRSPGGVRDGATFDFVRLDGNAKIEMLEIIGSDTTVMTSELSYWQKQAGNGRYHLQAVTIQGHSAWWIDAVEPQAGANRRATLWIDWEERSYRLRLYCQPEVCEESKRLLRQMLSTLALTGVDWNRAPGPPSVSSVETAPGEGVMTVAALASIPYDRNGAYAYADAYWEQEANDDGCYLWSNGSDLDCIEDSGDYGVDGAHFVNRAVYAGGRPIPGLWDNAALRVADLRNWLQGDGWTTAAASQAQVGDVAIMGPFTDPCWVGLVAVAGSDPTLATHSDEYWVPASTLYCYYNSQQTFEKTYLHADVEFLVYLPVVLRNYPRPPKQHTGVHLGNRVNDWTEDMLRPIDGDKGGSWPKAVVVLSNQVWQLERDATAPCDIINVYERSDRPVVYSYLKRAARSGVDIIFRVYPSPGNFIDWDQESASYPNHHLLTGTAPPDGTDYCQDPIPDDEKQSAPEYYRSIKDIADEMGYIYAAMVADGWTEGGIEIKISFEPANEPNTEWYTLDTDPAINKSDAWDEMDDYFSALYTYVHDHYSNVNVLTPPMAQAAYAEGIEWSDECVERKLIDGSVGYNHMETTYGTHNDGYSWHNYWNQGRESSATCENGGGHVYSEFPLWLQLNILFSDRVYISEADLYSQCQLTGNPLQWKDNSDDLTGSPAETTQSLLAFSSENVYLTDANIFWLLADNTGYSKTPDQCAGVTDPRLLREHDWHEAYDEDDRDPPYGELFREWFTTWWPQAN